MVRCMTTHFGSCMNFFILNYRYTISGKSPKVINKKFLIQGDLLKQSAYFDLVVCKGGLPALLTKVFSLKFGYNHTYWGNDNEFSKTIREVIHPTSTKKRPERILDYSTLQSLFWRSAWQDRSLEWIELERSWCGKWFRIHVPESIDRRRHLLSADWGHSSIRFQPKSNR